MAEPQQHETSGWPAIAPAGAWQPGALVEINQQIYECWRRGVSMLTAEIGQFVHARLDEDVSSWNRFTTCTDVGQALDCQRRYAEKVLKDYVDEFGKLSRLAAGLASDSWSSLMH